MRNIIDEYDLKACISINQTEYYSFGASPPTEKAMNVISVSRFKLLFPELVDMHIEDIRLAMQARNVDEALEIFDVAMGHFGIETIRGGWVDDYFQDIQLLYSESGHDHKPTLMFGTLKREVYLCSVEELLAQELHRFGRE
jgi:hypothetical protein